MPPHQLALSTFYSVARMHSLTKGIGLLLASSLLEQGVMLTHDQCAVLLARSHTLAP